MLEAHASRHAQACLQGKGHAVKLDIDDELNDAYLFVYERAGALAAEQFKRMYAEEELAFVLDVQANPDAVRRRILPDQPMRGVVVQSQLEGLRQGGTGWGVLAACFVAGLLVAVALHT
jgi:hypothetical protein